MLKHHLPHCLSGFMLLDKELHENVSTAYLIHFFILISLALVGVIADTIFVFELIRDNNRYLEILTLLNQSNVLQPFDKSLTCNQTINYQTFHDDYLSYNYSTIIYLILYTLGLVVAFVFICNIILWTVLKYHKQTPLLFRYVNSLAAFVLAFHQNIPQVIFLFAIIGLRHSPQGLYCAECLLTRQCVQSDASILTRSYGGTARFLSIMIYAIYYGAIELNSHVGKTKSESSDKTIFQESSVSKHWLTVQQKFYYLPVAIIYTLAYILHKILHFPVAEFESNGRCPHGLEFLRGSFWASFTATGTAILAIKANLENLAGSLFPVEDLGKMETITTVIIIILAYFITIAIITVVMVIKSQMKSGQTYFTAAMILLLFFLTAPLLLIMAIVHLLKELIGKY
ncbi:hypothetical protein TrispH2_004285 [Trichoplax sp. H2]|nr:hypothetical protein TrispH2_004285 [Trichoplax sp. H2]|eukprot:RDD43576.1 hypothetical protein TrispH2_004285 [Trichoplax sp. H2]